MKKYVFVIVLFTTVLGCSSWGPRGYVAVPLNGSTYQLEFPQPYFMDAAEAREAFHAHAAKLTLERNQRYFAVEELATVYSARRVGGGSTMVRRPRVLVERGAFSSSTSGRVAEVADARDQRSRSRLTQEDSFVRGVISLYDAKPAGIETIDAKSYLESRRRE